MGGELLVFGVCVPCHSFGTDALVATARKALFAVRQRCALLGIQDPALQCKLFDTLVLPILSYGCEVWGLDTDAKLLRCNSRSLHRDFLRRLLAGQEVYSKPQGLS